MEIYAPCLIGIGAIAVWIAFHHGLVAWRRRDAIQRSFALLALVIAIRCGIQLWFLRGQDLATLMRADLFSWVCLSAECWLLTDFVDRFTEAKARRFVLGAGLALGLLAGAVFILPYNFFADRPHGMLATTLPWGERQPAIDATFGVPYWLFLSIAGACLVRSLRSAWKAWRRSHRRRYLALLGSLGLILALILWGIIADNLGTIAAPVVEVGFAALAGIMGAVLTDEALRAARLEEQMRRTERLAAIGQLASGVAHDFGNILSGVIGNASLLAMDLADRPRLQELARSLGDGGQRGLSLVHQLTAFARGRPASNERIDLHTVVREVTALLQSGRGRTIEFEVRLQALRTVVEGDPARVHSLVLNLMTNARDAAMATRGRVTVETGLGPPPAGTVLRHQPRGDLLLWMTVRDTGPGMSAEVLPHLFEPYFTTKGERGTGLGLAQIDEALRQVGGALAIESRPGAGSAFTVWLPLADGSSTAMIAVGTRVLVNIEASIPHQLVCETLVSLGYEPVPGEVEIDALVAVLDADSGCGEASAFARLRQLRPLMPVVLLGGDAALAREGLITVLPRPVEPRDLALAVRRAINSAHRG